MWYQVLTVISLSSCAYLIDLKWDPDPLCPYPSDDLTKFQYYGNCSVYWACYDGSKFLVECPEGEEFDTVTKDCVSADVATCDPYPSTTSPITSDTTTTEQSSTNTTETVTDSTVTFTTTVTTTESTTTQGTTSSDGPNPNCPFPSEEIIYKPYEGDCTKYWECFEGDAYLYNCPGGLWWHQEVEQCDYPGDYCDGSTTSATTQSSS